VPDQGNAVFIFEPNFLVLGESNVYTLGTLGCHRVVTTKLPTAGHTREAMTAAGNTTTRLLGRLPTILKFCPVLTI
jgi:hypothetical protein